MKPDESLEQAARQQGYAIVCGCDEAGAGPLMGPVCAGAVILPPGCDIPGLDDSKKLTEKKREALYTLIHQEHRICSCPCTLHRVSPCYIVCLRRPHTAN